MASTAHTPQRLAATAALVLFVGGLAAEQAHVALVRHVRCAAHGELLHGGESAPAPAGEGARLSAGLADLEGHAHGHCTAASRSAPSAFAEGSVDGLVVGTWATDARPVLPGPRPRRVWALAPKGSPPRG